MAKREYKKLAGRGRRQGETYNWCTLHLGVDHLLQIEHSGYREDYRRYYFKDIQGFIIRKTNRARNYMIFFLITIVFGAGWELYVTAIEWRIWWAGWIALFLIPLMV